MFRTRRRSLVLTLFVLASLLGAPLLGATPAAAQVADTPPDLPAMLLRIEQIVEAGFAEQFFAYGASCYTPEQVAEFQAEALGMTPDEVLEQLEAFGFQRVCDAIYTVPGDGGQPGSAPPDLGISSYVILYEDAEGAEEGFEFYEDESGDPAAEDLVEGDDLGDQSEATLLSGSDDIGDYQSLDLTFRLDNLVAGVVVEDFTGDTPEYETAEELAGLLQERIETVLDEGGPGLSTLVLQMEGEGLPPTSVSRYLVLEDEGEQYADETEEEFEKRMEGYDLAEAVYYEEQALPSGEEGSEDDSIYFVVLYQFSGERAARLWLEEAPERYVENPDFLVRDEAPQFGDESLAISHGEPWDFSQPPVIYDRIVARVGDVGIDIGFRGQTIPTGIAEQVIEAQVACIEAGECTETVPVPAALLAGTVSDPTPEDEEETPEDEATPEPEDVATPEDEETPEATEAAHDHTEDGEVYESPQYGYTLTYDPNEWEIHLEDEDPDDPYDFISLFNGISLVGLTGNPNYAETELDSCIEDYIQFVEDWASASEVEPLQGRGNAGSENGVAWATYAYVYTNEDGAESESIRYYECRALGDGVTLVIMQDALADDFEEEVEAREELLEGLDTEG